MKKLLIAGALLLASSARADTFNYVFTNYASGLTISWSLTGVPNTPPPLPEFSSQIGQPGDVEVTVGTVTEPASMTMVGKTLTIQCDPSLLCLWDEVAAVFFDSNTALVSGNQLLSGIFTGTVPAGAPGGQAAELVVTDLQAATPEPSTAWMLLGAVPLLGLARRRANQRSL